MASLTDAQLPSTDEPAPDPMSLEMPPMLLGTYTPKIDAKGRVALPANMRAQLGRGMVMARGQLTGHPRFKRRPEVEAQLDRFLTDESGAAAR